MTGRATFGVKARYLLASAGGVTIVGACACGVLLVQAGGASAVPAVRPATAGSNQTSAEHGQYRNGLYSAVGHYATPGGNESIGVTVAVVNQQITGVDVKVEATSPTARQFQEQFRTRILPAIISKDLASAKVSRVAGASLTSVGFNDALQRIRAAANA